MAKNVLNFLSEETFVEEAQRAIGYLKTIAAGVGVGYKPESNAELQELVRSGRHKSLLSIGDSITCMRKEQKITWDIVGMDIDTPSDPQFEHSLTLVMRDPYDLIQFSAPQAMYYAEEELPAGVYHVTPKNGWATGMGNGKTYVFTLTKPVPAGGQIVWNGTYDSDPIGYKIYTYASRTSTQAIESVAPVEGSDGTELSEINHPHRMCYGSDDYELSAIRQIINSDAAAGSVWVPQSKYDRPPSWNTLKDGFLNGLDEEFLAIVGKTKKTTNKCRLVENGVSVTNDKFFLLSQTELYAGDVYSDSPEGSPYPYFANYSDYTSPNSGADKNRIKYWNGNPRFYYGRTPGPNYANFVRGINAAGELDNNYASSTYGAVLGCNII